MKNKVYIGIVLGIALILLGGCKKTTPAQESAETFVNAVIYDKEVDKLADIFDGDSQGIKEESETTFMKVIKENLSLDDSYVQKLITIFEKMEADMRDKTSFSTKVINEEKGKVEIEIAVIGLAEVDDATLDKSIEAELEKDMKELTAETTDEEIATLINAISFAVLEKLSADRPVAEKATIVTMDLMVDSTDKSKWVIRNQDRFINELLEAFGQ